MRHILDVVQGDLLEFDLIFKKCNHEEFIPDEGDEYFFEIEIPNAENISIQQPDKHFKIKEINLNPGMYPMAAGIIFYNGDKLTVLKKQQNILRVLERVKEDEQ